MDVKRNYFESDLGEGKAKYWTLNIEEAHRFNSIDEATEQLCKLGNDSNLLIVFYVQIMPDDFVMQLHRF
ncbi:hypothetical protein ED318_26140 [Salmonella enterica]|nr:hypothetical protein [Salmonella enterica]